MEAAQTAQQKLMRWWRLKVKVTLMVGRPRYTCGPALVSQTGRIFTLKQKLHMDLSVKSIANWKKKYLLFMQDI